MKYTVLTYIIGNYQKVHEIKNKQDDVEYLLVTDNPLLKSNTWTVIYDETLLKMESIWNRCYSIRFNLFNYCKTDICVRIDGSIGIKKSLDPIVNKFIQGNYDLALLPHMYRYNIKDQLKAWRDRNYSYKNIIKQLNFLQKSNYPIDTYKGLIGFTFCIVKNTKQQKQLDQLTYYFLSYLSDNLKQFERLDQTIFTYVLNTYFSHLKIFPLSYQILNSDVLNWYKHNSDIIAYNEKYDIHDTDKKYLFNKLVQCYYIFDNQCKTLF